MKEAIIAGLMNPARMSAMSKPTSVTASSLFCVAGCKIMLPMDVFQVVLWFHF